MLISLPWNPTVADRRVSDAIPPPVDPVSPLSTPVLNDGGVMLVLVLVRRHATLIAGVCEGHSCYRHRTFAMH